MNIEHTYILTGAKFTGVIVFKFALNGLLKAFKIEAELSQLQHRTILSKVPIHVSQVKQLEQLGNVDIEEVPADLSFDNFWKTYGNYAGKKKACRQMWENLSQQDKTAAMNGISIYKQRKAQDKTALTYPDTYLRNRIWE